jgi:NTE family protein
MDWWHIAALAVIPLSVVAQPSSSDSKSRPTIGVALAGGGALGLAHIGVLQWLEEHRIPIDYVAGTSMGGLIGGVYATGMHPQEIQDLVSHIDWDDVLRGQTLYGDLSYRRKEDRRAFPNSLQFGLRHGFSIPSGLNVGQKITYIFDRLALPYSQLASFDDLPIPFRCVGTDLIAGKPHIFSSGSIAEALRSTMSLPAVFTPVKTGESLYADGGLLDNLPVDVVRAMGADIVIAVTLNPTTFTGEGNLSMFSIMGRSISVMISANELRSIAAADLLISVDLAGYDSTAYTAASKIIPRGYEAAEKKSQLLSRLSLDETEWAHYLAQREGRRIRSVPTPTFIEVNGVAEPLARDIEKALAVHVGKPLTPDKLERDINLIGGNGRFSSISYALAKKDGKEGLVVRGNEKEYAPPFLNLGIVIDGSEYDNVRFTANARITALDLGGFRSEWRTDFSLGSDWRVASEFYKPFSPTTKWFIAPRVYATNVPLDLYDHSTRIATYRIRQHGGGFDLGYAINRWSELRLGYDIRGIRSSLNIGSPVLPTPAGRFGSTSVRYSLDRLDSPLVPRRGEIVRARLQWNDAVPGAPRAFPASELYFGIARPVSKPASVYVQGFAGSTFGYNNTGVPQFFLGGLGRLDAYGTNEFRTNQYFLFRLGYVHELFRLPPFVGDKVYFTSAYELGKIYGVSGESRVPNDAAVGVIFETFLGPLGVGGSVGDAGHRKWYFGIGRIF